MDIDRLANMKSKEDIEFLEKIQSLRTDEDFYKRENDIYSGKYFAKGKEYVNSICDATKTYITVWKNQRIEGIVKDKLLKLIKDTIEWNSRIIDFKNLYDSLTNDAKILFVSKSDLEFVTIFNKKLKQTEIEWKREQQFLLAENIHEFNSTAHFFMPNNEKIFELSNWKEIIV